MLLDASRQLAVKLQVFKAVGGYVVAGRAEDEAGDVRPVAGS